MSYYLIVYTNSTKHKSFIIHKPKLTIVREPNKQYYEITTHQIGCQNVKLDVRLSKKFNHNPPSIYVKSARQRSHKHYMVLNDNATYELLLRWGI